MSMASRAILSNFFEEQCPQSHPRYLSGLSRAFFPPTFLEIAVNNKDNKYKVVNRVAILPIDAKYQGTTFFISDEKNGCMRCLDTSIVPNRHLDREPLLWLANGSPCKCPQPLFFGENEMNWMYNYLGHCFFLPLSLSLPSSPPSSTSLMLPPCHHHCIIDICL